MEESTAGCSSSHLAISPWVLLAHHRVVDGWEASRGTLWRLLPGAGTGCPCLLQLERNGSVLVEWSALFQKVSDRLMMKGDAWNEFIVGRRVFRHNKV